MPGMKMTFESVNDDIHGAHFLFQGVAPNGEEFCGTAGDLATAFSMAVECLQMSDACPVADQPMSGKKGE